jgi:hypothetical protein
LRSYDHGCLVVGVAGAVDRAMAERLGTLLRDLRPHSSCELVISFTLLDDWDPHLARVIGRARIQHLLDHARVELHDPPAALVAAALGQHPQGS